MIEMAIRAGVAREGTSVHVHPNAVYGYSVLGINDELTGMEAV